MTRSLVLLGDNIIDNIPYVAPGEPGVVAQIAARALDWVVDARALDGATAAEVYDVQLAAAVDPDALVILSAGGNDALNHIHLVEDTTERPAADLLVMLHGVREAFRRDYARVLDRIVEMLSDRAAPRALALTIYNPRFEFDAGDYTVPPGFQQAAEAALSLFNDVIQQEALARGFGLLDLRRLCAGIEDFANPIEPSAIGGAKIADAVVAWAEAGVSTRGAP